MVIFEGRGKINTSRHFTIIGLCVLLVHVPGFELIAWGDLTGFVIRGTWNEMKVPSGWQSVGMSGENVLGSFRQGKTVIATNVDTVPVMDKAAMELYEKSLSSLKKSG